MSSEFNPSLPSGEAKPTRANEAHLESINEASELPMYLAGGYGEEALLGGEVTKEHKDIDFLAARPDVPKLIEDLQQKGFETRLVGTNLEDAFMLFVTKDGIDMDIILVNKDQEGIHADIPGPDGAKYRIFLDDNAFEHPTVGLNGTTAKPVSPLTLVQARYIVRNIQGMPAREGHDDSRQQALIDKYFPGMTEEELKPRVVKLG